MSFLNFFKKKKIEKPDPITGISLSNLKPGFFVDFDMKTWEVAAYNYYDWGDGDITYEWQLKTSDDTVYLEREPDDEDFWCISRKIPFETLGPGLREHIMKHEDSPGQIIYKGVTFHLDESGGGYFYKDGSDPKKELLKWDYTDDSGSKFISVEQWSEADFEASYGMRVEEYQFANILPGPG